jgi:xanthosine phosphorylase
MTDSIDAEIAQSARLIRDAAGKLQPKIAVILGSGLGAVADLLDETAQLSYDALPGFPAAGVQGHEGSLRIGTVGETPVLFLKGRVHLYEGKGSAPIKVMLRSLKSAGVETLFLTNAAGSLDPAYGAGSVVAITDHINLMGINPLSGPNDDAWGPRFPSMDNAWDADLRRMLLEAAAKAGVNIGQGVYAAFLGPSFETHAEIRMAKAIGADLVGMSTVAEALIARHCGLACVGCSAVTNMGAGLGDIPLSHAQTLHYAEIAGRDMANLLKVFLTDFG